MEQPHGRSQLVCLGARWEVLSKPGTPDGPCPACCSRDPRVQQLEGVVECERGLRVA